MSTVTVLTTVLALMWPICFAVLKRNRNIVTFIHQEDLNEAFEIVKEEILPYSASLRQIFSTVLSFHCNKRYYYLFLYLKEGEYCCQFFHFCVSDVLFEISCISITDLITQ